MWIDRPIAADTRTMFRGAFRRESAGEIEVRVLAVSWFNAWLDGREVLEGPDRFAHSEPAYQSIRLDLAAGEHVLAVEVHHHGVATQQLQPIDPFLWCEILAADGDAVPVEWRARPCEDSVPAVRRINPNLAWVEWRDARLQIDGWTDVAFDDTAWDAPLAVARDELGPIGPPTGALVQSFEVAATQVGEGLYANRYATIFDDPPLTVVRRDLDPSELQPNGCWFRFDLGAVHLGRPRVVLDVPEGTGIELVYSEALHDGRALPWLSCSNGLSANMDHYLARGEGAETFQPSAPRGMRFFEVHVLAPRADVRLVEAGFTERTYFPEPTGALSCGDEQLEQIWATGLRTLRSCAEDAITDCPTRERGQWVGDAAVGLETASVGWSDLRLVARALRHAADAASSDGLVAGNAPGGVNFHLSSFSCIWASTAWRYFCHTGDRSLLEDLLPAARRNIDALAAHLGEDGLDRDLPWAFIDWGYVSNDGPSDMALNLLFIAALDASARWADALGEADGQRWRALADTTRTIVSRWMAEQPDGLRYHVNALALRVGLVPAEREPAAVAAMKAHLLDCFPNDPTAPQLGTPEMNHPRVITPYFSHWAFPPLLDRGETDFVVDQWRACWGWMLGRGHGTFLEVFDERWSHSHQWSAGPAWQLSRYLLGLHPRFDLGDRTYEVRHRPGSMARARGVLPAAGGDVSVEWTAPVLRVTVDRPITLRLEDGSTVEVERDHELPLGAS
jgi:alpha-L-rhamnosidase